MLFWFSCPVQFSCSDVSNFLPPHESQHIRPPCPSPTPRIYSNSCPLSWWCHPAISSSVIPFSSYPQSLPESGSFPMSQLFTRGGQSIGVLFSCPVMSSSLWPHGLQHTRPPCPSPSPEVAQAHVHCIGDTILPSHPLMASSSALNVSQNQGLLQWISSSY